MECTPRNLRWQFLVAFQVPDQAASAYSAMHLEARPAEARKTPPSESTRECFFVPGSFRFLNFVFVCQIDVGIIRTSRFDDGMHTPEFALAVCICISGR